jgi:hypothetical protein
VWGKDVKVNPKRTELIWSSQMTEAVTINDQELAILCDIVGGWSVKWAENLDVDKRQALDRLIANGFVER